MYTDQNGQGQIRTGVAGELPGPHTTHAAIAISWASYSALCEGDPVSQATAEGRAWGHLYAALLGAYDLNARRVRRAL